MPGTLLETIFFMVPHVLLTYSVLYWVVPRYLQKGRYVLTLLLTLALLTGTAFFSALLTVYVNQPLIRLLLPSSLQSATRSWDLNLYLGLLAGFRGGISIFSLGAAIKLMKYWHFKEQRNLQLQKEKAEAQLELLKAQVHPHFLFNTLNNIYSLVQQNTEEASRLIMGLSDLLRFVLYEGNSAHVPLSQELKMLEEYIGLERVRYGNQLHLHVSFPSGAEDLAIAPLLLLPFVENSFKHGASDMVDQPWINLEITLSDYHMHLKLMNGKAVNPRLSAHSGIGISNVRQRLGLLYPGRHLLKVKEEEEVFIVELEMDLQPMPASSATYLSINPLPAYA